ncbi:MAG: terminase small subunit, partial [Nitrospinales bacterium]
MKPLNPRQERFCHAFVEYACASVAACEAGYNRGTSRQQGWRLMQDPRIRDRIAAIQAGLARDHALTRDVLMGKLEVVYRRAMRDHHFYAAARAVELQGRLAGLG